MLLVERRDVQSFPFRHEALLRARLGGSMADGGREVREDAGPVGSEGSREGCVEKWCADPLV